MLDLMYDIPSQADVETVTITEEVVFRKAPPLLALRAEKRKKEA